MGRLKLAKLSFDSLGKCADIRKNLVKRATKSMEVCLEWPVIREYGKGRERRETRGSERPHASEIKKERDERVEK